MTMGPEPTMRMRWMSVRRGMNEVGDDGVHVPRGSPPERAQPRVAADEGRDVGWTRERWVDPELGLDADARQHAAREGADLVPDAAADVVRLARGPALQQHNIGGGHVG